MSAIVHRQRRRRAATVPVRDRRGRSGAATATIVAFLALAVLVAGIELWPAVTAIAGGVTDYSGTLSPVLPTAFRNGSMVALPALVAWASPERPTGNGWLWRGALISAVVALARYLAGPIQQQIVAGAGDQLTAQSPEYLLASAIGIVLAFASLLGVWALSEGIKDAGARTSSTSVALAVLFGLAAAVLVFGPSLASLGDAATAGRVNVPLFAVSLVVNALYFITQALLALRTVTGLLRRDRPRVAWAAGATGAVVLFVYPFVTLLRLMLTQYVTDGADALPIPDVLLRVVVFFGWPLVAVGIANGMGVVRLVAPKLTATGFTVRGAARYTPVV